MNAKLVRPLLKALCLAAVLALPSSVGLQAQDVTGNVAGRVVDADGLPLEGVAVQLADESRSITFDAVTGPRGDFRFLALSVGEYGLRFQRIGYRTVLQSSVLVRLGATVSTGEVVLPVQAVPLAPIEIAAEGALAIDPTSTIVGSTIDSEIFEQLPTGRDYKDVIALLPGANESFLGDPVNIGGATGLGNQFFVDGANVTDVHRGRTGTDLPFNFIEAIELKQGGYMAENASALGGLVNVTTRSGTNDFKMDGFGYLSGDALRAAPKPVPGVVQTTGFADYDFGVSVSGPVVRDKLWFFTAYNPSFVTADVDFENFGPQSATTTKHMFAGKLDWQTGSRSRLSLSVFGDPTTRDQANPPPSGSFYENIDFGLKALSEGGVNASLNGSAWLGPNWLLEGTTGYHSRREEAAQWTEIGRTQPVFFDLTHPDGIAISGGGGEINKTNTSRTFLKGAATLFAGGHAIKFGGEYQGTRLDRDWHDLGFFTKYAENEFDNFYIAWDFTVHNRIGSAFIQDSWVVSPRWQVNLGLRWEGQWIDGGEGGTQQPILDQWQPRAGLVFQPGELGTQKVFGYAGRYYQPLALYIVGPQFALGAAAGLEFYSVDPRVNPDSIDSVFELGDPAVVVSERVDGMNGEHLDEFVLGYERLLGSSFKLGIKGIHRVLRDNIDVVLAGGIGNRGKGDLEEFGDPERTYWAGEFTLQYSESRASFLASYVLSRTHGNYQGLFASEGEVAGALETGGFAATNFNKTLLVPAQLVNNRGLLPNDRTHVAKFSGSYGFDFGLRVGSALTIASGTPLNELQMLPTGFGTPLFLVPRGSDGRTSAIWDLGFRVSYDLPTRLRGRAFLDLLHIGNPQGVTNVDQVRYNTSQCDDGQGGAASCGAFVSYEEAIAGAANPNLSYGNPTAFQPPFTVRLGFQVDM